MSTCVRHSPVRDYEKEVWTYSLKPIKTFAKISGCKTMWCQKSECFKCNGNNKQLRETLFWDDLIWGDPNLRMTLISDSIWEIHQVATTLSHCIGSVAWYMCGVFMELMKIRVILAFVGLESDWGFYIIWHELTTHIEFWSSRFITTSQHFKQFT